MSKLIKIMAGLAFVIVGVATPGLHAHADATQDQDFYRLVVNDGWVVYDFPLLRSQGIASCQQMDAGATPMQAVYSLDGRYGGPYPFDLANSVSSAAGTIYCHWHDTSLGEPNWPYTPTPVYPLPVYPPLAWYPPPPPSPPPGYHPPPGYPGPNV